MKNCQIFLGLLNLSEVFNDVITAVFGKFSLKNLLPKYDRSAHGLEK